MSFFTWAAVQEPLAIRPSWILNYSLKCLRLRVYCSIGQYFLNIRFITCALHRWQLPRSLLKEILVEIQRAPAPRLGVHEKQTHVWRDVTCVTWAVRLMYLIQIIIERNLNRNTESSCAETRSAWKAVRHVTCVTWRHMCDVSCETNVSNPALLALNYNWLLYMENCGVSRLVI